MHWGDAVPGTVCVMGVVCAVILWATGGGLTDWFGVMALDCFALSALNAWEGLRHG